MPKKAKPLAKQSTVLIVDSVEPDKIRDEMAKGVDGWADMSADVQEQIIALNAEVAVLRRAPKLSVKTIGENAEIGMNENNPQLHTLRLIRTFASSSGAFLNYVLSSLGQYLKTKGGLTVDNLNAALAFIDGIGPRNEAETLLALQMFMTNDAAMRGLRVMNGSDWVDTVDKFGNLSVKLLRTSTMQAEALAKLQRGGVQRVEHYYIDNRGGQAVIADNVTTGGQTSKIEGQSYATSCSGDGSALPCENPQGRVVPIASRQGARTMQDARGD